MIEVPIPGNLKVGGHDYTVRSDEKARDVLEGAACWGLHRYTKQELLIDPTCSPQETSLVFIHECIHAIGHIYCGHAIEDNTAEPLAQGLLQVMEQLGVRFVLPPVEQKP